MHNRYLADKSKSIADEISNLFLPLLTGALKRKFHYLRDPHLVETVANDALLNYLKHPEKFDPEKRSLIGYLYMDACGNLLNLLKQQQRLAELQRAAMENELKATDRAYDPERLLIEAESSIIKQMGALVTDPVDRELVSLMMEGVRETEAYAEALGLQAIPVAEQAVIVKRHKDRLKAHLRRGINRRRLASVIAFMIGLRERVRAAGLKPRLIAASVLLVAILLSVGIYLWQRNSVEVTTNGSRTAGAGVPPDGGLVSGPGGLRGRYVEKILFTSNRGAKPGIPQTHIWMMNPDGTGLEQVTFGDVYDAHPELSRDGTKLVFSRIKSPTDTGGQEVKSIWVRDMITGAETPITSDTDYPWGSYDSYNPSWSPTGKQIAFNRYVVPIDYPEDKNGSFDSIWVVDYLPAVGTPKQLSPESSLRRIGATWSADGSHIFYGCQLWRDSPQAIYKINIATGQEEQVIPLVLNERSLDSSGELAPSISPDGSKIAWWTGRHGINGGDVYIADTANPVNSQFRVTPYSGWGGVVWSPDGQRLVLTLGRFKLTEKSLESLRAIGFTDEFLEKLKNVNDKEFITEKEFLDGLKSAIGEELTDRYSYKILANAIRENSLWVANADGDGFTQLTFGLWVDVLYSWGNLFQPDTDLAIIINPSQESISPGSRLSYSIVVTNNSKASARGVVVKSTLSDSTKFISCSSTGGGVFDDTCKDPAIKFSSLAPGESATITITMQVNHSVANGESFNTTATVSSFAPDLNAGNNSATTRVTVSNFAVIAEGAKKSRQ